MKIEAESPVLKNYPVNEHRLGVEPGSPFGAVPIVRLNEEGVFVSRHVLDEEARETLARTGVIYALSTYAPVRLSAVLPDYTLAVYTVEIGDETPRQFDGFDVRTEGGTEEERLAYARTETAEFVASALTLPARVQMLREDMPWMEGAGEGHESAQGLQAAIERRLDGLPYTGQRVELRDAAGVCVRISMAEALAPECASASV